MKKFIENQKENKAFALLIALCLFTACNSAPQFLPKSQIKVLSKKNYPVVVREVYDYKTPRERYPTVLNVNVARTAQIFAQQLSEAKVFAGVKFPHTELEKEKSIYIDVGYSYEQGSRSFKVVVFATFRQSNRPLKTFEEQVTILGLANTHDRLWRVKANAVEVAASRLVQQIAADKSLNSL